MRKIIAIDLFDGGILYKDNNKYFIQRISSGIVEIPRVKVSLIVIVYKYFNSCYAPKNY